MPRRDIVQVDAWDRNPTPIQATTCGDHAHPPYLRLHVMPPNSLIPIMTPADVAKTSNESDASDSDTEPEVDTPYNAKELAVLVKVAPHAVIHMFPLTRFCRNYRLRIQSSGNNFVSPPLVPSQVRALRDQMPHPQTHSKSMLKSLISLAVSSASSTRYGFVHLTSTNPILSTSVKLAHDTRDVIAMIGPSMMVSLLNSTTSFHLTFTCTLRVPSSSPTRYVWSLSPILLPRSPIPVHFWSRINEDIRHQQCSQGCTRNFPH